MVRGQLVASRYQLVEELGSGGMGSVWRAVDLKLNAEVAIKVVDSEFAMTAEGLARFRGEAEAAAAIRSTHVVQILDYGVDGDVPFIAMELLRGDTLALRLMRAGKLSPGHTAHILGHVSRALELAHQHGIVHRDLKPENVFLIHEGEEDVAKVLDFGIARRLGGFSEASGLKTKTGTILGTPYYMSPEQATGQLVDHLSDIWAFGTIAFECLTGQRAFTGETLGGLFHRICMADLPIPSQYARVPAEFDAWFAKATNRDKMARFQSVREAAETLRAVCGHSSGRSPVMTARGDRDSDSRTSVIPPAPTAAFESIPGTAISGNYSPSIPPAVKTNRRKQRSGVLMAGLIAAPVVLGVGGYGLIAGGYALWRHLERESPTSSATQSPSSGMTSPAESEGVASTAPSVVPAVTPSSAALETPSLAAPSPATSTSASAALATPPPYAETPADAAPGTGTSTGHGSSPGVSRRYRGIKGITGVDPASSTSGTSSARPPGGGRPNEDNAAGI